MLCFAFGAREKDRGAERKRCLSYVYVCLCVCVPMYVDICENISSRPITKKKTEGNIGGEAKENNHKKNNRALDINLLLLITPLAFFSTAFSAAIRPL